MNKEERQDKKVHNDDSLLVEEFQSNNEKAFDILVLKYQDRIFNMCYRLLGDYDEANDCAQETFIKVYKNLHNFRFQSSFSTWLYRIAINTCKNLISSSKRRMSKKMIRLNHTQGPEETTVEISDSSYNPADMFESSENEKLIQRAINMLPEKQKILIVLRDIEGKSYEEIAEITGYKLGTVKSKLARGRQVLREILRSDF